MELEECRPIYAQNALHTG